ncbi:small ribosomal subunit biogenesis GTPase RsgA [Catenovulum sp. SM1970]|uniref:small ribosomal subunit biogenesis GTPase RsgA n=1 Tax=Marinifaba aquimaris TaxID=2741323 RepID=UPI0015731E72|nr:small ribosomal subunit biogenesis GTPase RsgA [Marinifaba aquimaris]
MAKKKKLNKQQQRRLSANQSRKLSRKNQAPEPESSMLGPALSGLVISRYGQHADIENEQGELKRCDLRRSVRSLVAGDQVVWRELLDGQGGSDGVVEAVEERKSVLTRPDYYDGLKAVAANIEQVVVLSSIKPDLSLQIIDRYLVAVEHMGAQPIIAINKIELLSADELTQVKNDLAYYEQIGYKVYFVSVKDDIGVASLLAELNQQVSIVVGQSGVGKSSLVNILLPETNADVGAISDNSGLGQHTTTVARLYHMPSGGRLIDSPGIREFSLWHLTPEDIFDGFIEFGQYKTCKFRDCKHKDDPKCGIREALERGLISQSRFDNYHRIIESLAQDKPNRFVEL